MSDLHAKLEAQKAASRSPVSVVVTAGAGTGKSHMLAERYLYHLEQHLSPLEVVAVTFTEKAAAELRARIRTMATARLPDQADTLAELEFAQISTIHALAARICRDHWRAAGVSPDFKILDDLDGNVRNAQWLDEALARLPAHIYAQVPYSVLRPMLKAFFDDPVVAEWALGRGPELWKALVERERDMALNSLVSRQEWLQAHNALREFSGKAGDKLEDWRKLALEAVLALERGESARQHLETIAAVKLNVGSAKAWGGGGLEAVKEALRSLRDDCVKPALDAGLVTLELGSADDRLADVLPALRDAFSQAGEIIASAKRRANVLDFADLEVCALRALKDLEVQSHYAERWRAILVDEFQDTNAVQAELLERLTAGQQVITTIVGDEKQSIYGFRRADVSVFRKVREGIIGAGGQSHALSVSFRTHSQLIETLNTIFAPVLGDMHQSLDADRVEAPHAGPHLHAYVVQASKGVRKAQRHLTEARHIAQEIRRMLDEKVPVHDKATGGLRPARPSDFAVLSRTWEPLDICGEVIANHGVPVIHSGGGNLLDMREAKDAWAMLRFLADPSDDLALVAVLRSPFFAISDRELLTAANKHPPGSTWWSRVRHSPEVEFPSEVLGELLKLRHVESPSRLLQVANRLTGYCAVIANLPGPERREADWRGFLDLVMKLERHITDLSVLVRQIRRLIVSEVKVPRPVVEARDAVSLMTIHGSKGLEWPVVIVPDLARESPGSGSPVYFDEELGVAFNFEDEDGHVQTPALHTILEQRHDTREVEEAKRVLYVALTRARDHVILCSTEARGGGLDLLLPGLDAAGVYFEPLLFDPELDLLHPPADPPPYVHPAEEQIGPVSFSFGELPILALGDYGVCPARFRFNYHEGHPGIGDEISSAERVARLVRKSFELDIVDERRLARYDASLPLEQVREALTFAKRFREDPAFEPLRGERDTARPIPVTLKQGAVTLHGTADLVGSDFVAAFDCSHEVFPEHSLLKLWAYAVAAGKPLAHLVSLRHNLIYTFDASALEEVGARFEGLIRDMQDGRYAPSPSAAACGCCLYAGICEDRYQSVTDAGSR